MNRIAKDGFELIERVLQPEEVDKLLTYLETEAGSVKGKGGIRNLLDLALMRSLAQTDRVRHLVEAVLGARADVVRGILFDKNSDANWKVPWHQDVTIAVDSRMELSGYGPWSRKSGVHHVQPPREVMQRMVSVRIHLDDCPRTNGALKVLPGSHLSGKLSSNEVEHWVDRVEPFVCEIKRGGVLLMRPLLLHASSAASVPAHRRVIHFDYAAIELPHGLRWAETAVGRRTRLTP